MNVFKSLAHDLLHARKRLHAGAVAGVESAQVVHEPTRDLLLLANIRAIIPRLPHQMEATDNNLREILVSELPDKRKDGENK